MKQFNYNQVLLVNGIQVKFGHKYVVTNAKHAAQNGVYQNMTGYFTPSPAASITASGVSINSVIMPGGELEEMYSKTLPPAYSEIHNSYVISGEALMNACLEINPIGSFKSPKRAKPTKEHRHPLTKIFK